MAPLLVRPRLSTTLLLLGLSGIFFCLPNDNTRAQSTGDGSFSKVVQPFFAKHCLACHSEGKEHADVRLDIFYDDVSLPKGLATLEKVSDMLRRHKMPPAKQPQPGDAEVKPVLGWLDT